MADPLVTVLQAVPSAATEEGWPADPLVTALQAVPSVATQRGWPSLLLQYCRQYRLLLPREFADPLVTVPQAVPSAAAEGDGRPSTRGRLIAVQRQLAVIQMIRKRSTISKTSPILYSRTGH